MKKLSLFLSAILMVCAALSSCGPKCKECRTGAMGFSVSVGELCGDDLKKAEKMPEFTCK